MKYQIRSIVAASILCTVGIDRLNAVAQTATDNFPLPKEVPAGTKIQIDGSSSMQAVNQGLKERFQQQFPGTDITIPAQYQGSDAGIKSVENGKADLASIGRLLTKEETAKGIAAKAIGRSKIAIIVKENNPYTGNLTLKDFARIYRGEVTDWSQLSSANGATGKIKVIDRPNTSDTRRAFANYPVFQGDNLKTGSNAEKLTEDSTQAVVDKLGEDGIGYAPVDQVKNIPGVRAVTLHGTQPDNPQYPFSQPLVYAYKNKDGQVSAGVKAFLGYVSDPTGKIAINESLAAGVVAGAAAIDASPRATADGSNTTNTTAGASPTATADGTNSTGATSATTAAKAPIAAITDTTGTSSTTGGFPWWILPLVALGGGLLWLLGRKKPTDTVTHSSASYVPTRKSTRGAVAPMSPAEMLSPDLRRVWLAVKNEPTNFDSIMTHSQRSIEHVNSALSELESMGLITQLPNRQYQRSN
jgi:phosphate transport system substrate-binding protein